jgi:hypothetical protein
MEPRLRNTALTNIIIVIYFNNFLAFALSNVTVFGLRCFADYESPDGSVETDVVACPEVEGFSKKGKILQHRIPEHRKSKHYIEMCFFNHIARTSKYFDDLTKR